MSNMYNIWCVVIVDNNSLIIKCKRCLREILRATTILIFSSGASYAYYGEYAVIGDDTFFVTDTKYGVELCRISKEAPNVADVFGLAPDGVGIFNDEKASSDPEELVKYENTLYFSATNSHFGRELWKYDSATNTVRMVKDINVGAWGSAPTNLTVFKGTLYFIAYTSSGGRELWRSDGSEEGTVMVTDILSGEGNPRLSSLTHVGDKLLFFGVTESKESALWVSDGSRDGTRMIRVMLGMRAYFPPQTIDDFGNQLHYITWERGGDAVTWKTDGTVDGTEKLTAMDEERVVLKATDKEDKTKFSPLKGVTYRKVYGFGEKDMSYRIDWEKLKAKVSRPRIASVKDGDISWIGDTFIFAGETEKDGIELWKSDGTLKGTMMVKDIHTGRYHSGANYSIPREFITHDGAVYFIADHAAGHNMGLWRTDGTDAGTYPVLQVKDGIIKKLIRYRDSLYFLRLNHADGTRRYSLWKSDGTVGGTIRVGK